ncbi:hypothetical protein [Nocardia sp. NPDC050406]|uniref:hypothetical protein n=1 Tax=Nocardia sp. NPDC050406 TaxID=3364318 RepID=UPI0037A03C7E
MVLFLLLTVVALPVVFAWFVSAFSWRVCSAVALGVARSQALRRFGVGFDEPGQLWLVTAAMWSISSLVWLVLLAPVALVVGVIAASIPVALWVVGGLLLVPVMYAILIVGEYLPWSTATAWYGLADYRPDAPVREAVVKACAPYADRLRRIADDDLRRMGQGSDEVVVYRGGNPFVGAGTRVRAWSAAFELHPAEQSAPSTSRGDAPSAAFRPSDLQQHVAKEMAKLRDGTDLAPGYRFTELEISRWVMLAAAELPDAAEFEVVMSQLLNGIHPWLPEQDWNRLADNSPESARFYQCYRIEGWARQLAVAGYLHVGREEQMLVLEWHAFVLPPVAADFRRVDDPPTMLELRSMGRALARLALLPTTMPSRLLDVLRGMRERSAAAPVSWSTPTQAAATFGSATSIREFAAGTRLNNLFQESDRDRYLKIMERRMLSAVRQFLEERGLVARGFEEMVSQINNSTIFNHSNVAVGNIGGQSNTANVSTGSQTATGDSD